jgi:drug/metabolite transporter (DMT)-like permease
VVAVSLKKLFATVMLVAWTSTQGLALPRGRSLALCLAAGACFGTDLALWHSAIVRTSVANATLLVNTTPVYVGVFSVLALGERLGRRFVTATLLALVGTTLLLGADRGSQGAVSGDLLALCAALFYSGYLLLMKSVRRGTGAAASLLATGVGATIVLLVYSVALELPLRGFPLSSWAAMGGAALVSQIGGVMGIVWALRYLRATFASVALLVQPVGTTLLGWLLLGESVSGIQVLGGVAVLAGIVLASPGGADPSANPARSSTG